MNASESPSRDKGGMFSSVRWPVLSIVVFLSVAIALATSLKLQLLWLTLLLCVAAALHWHDDVRRRQNNLPTIIRSLLRLAGDRPLADLHQELVSALLQVADRKDTIFRALASLQLDRLIRDTRSLGDGRIEYASTEAWRLAYEQLLRSPGLYQYRSVALVETHHYWQDGPGRQSTLLNIELQQAGIVVIERIVILATHLWPVDQSLPEEPVQSWIDEQSRAGINILLVRESQLKDEPELLSDFGIYGSRAVGMQRLDAAGRTTRFILSFDFDEVCRAEGYWERLKIFASSRHRPAADAS